MKTQPNDLATMFAKSVVGAAPVVGSLLSEVAGAIIPNQRIDRIAKFAEILEQRLSTLEESFLRSQLSNEEFVGIMEEAMIQASRSTSNDRREYLASIVASGLTDKEIEYNETRRILTILGELSDAEVILLRSYLVRTIGGDEEFREKHKNIVMRQQPVIAAPQIEKDKYAITVNYREHLISMGLLENEYQLERETGLQKIDTFTNAPEIRGRSLTGMGIFFLRQIGLAEIKK